jgi:hypothetical protein
LVLSRANRCGLVHLLRSGPANEQRFLAFNEDSLVCERNLLHLFENR